MASAGATARARLSGQDRWSGPGSGPAPFSHAICSFGAWSQAARRAYKVSLAFPQQIERKKQSRSLLRQFLYPARSRMNALQKIIEQKLTTEDNFVIESEAFFPKGQRGGNDFRKIAAQILAGLGIHRHGLSVARQKTPRAIPFGLILPHLASRYGFDRARFIGSNAWLFFTPLCAFSRDALQRASCVSKPEYWLSCGPSSVSEHPSNR